MRSEVPEADVAIGPTLARVTPSGAMATRRPQRCVLRSDGPTVRRIPQACRAIGARAYDLGPVGAERDTLERLGVSEQRGLLCPVREGENACGAIAAGGDDVVIAEREVGCDDRRAVTDQLCQLVAGLRIPDTRITLRIEGEERRAGVIERHSREVAVARRSGAAQGSALRSRPARRRPSEPWRPRRRPARSARW